MVKRFRTAISGNCRLSGILEFHSEAPSAILFGYSELAENLWKVALYNLESIDGFYLATLGSRFRATVMFIQKPNFVYSDLDFSKLDT